MGTIETNPQLRTGAAIWNDIEALFFEWIEKMAMLSITEYFDDMQIFNIKLDEMLRKIEYEEKVQGVNGKAND